MQLPPEDRTLEARAASDPTLEAPPEEPTVSAQVDVRAAFAAQDVALPKGAAILGSEEAHPAHRQEHTLRLRPQRAPTPAPESGPSVESGRGVAHHTASEEAPYEIPGVGPPRRSMKGVVFAVLASCGLLCVGAAAVSLWPHPKSAEQTTSASAAGSSTSTREAAQVPAPNTSVTVAESTPAAPVVSAPPVVQVAPPVPAPAIAPAPAVVPVAAVEPAPAAASRAPRAAPAVAATTARPRPTTTAKPTGKGSIVRDAPF